MYILYSTLKDWLLMKTDTKMITLEYKNIKIPLNKLSVAAIKEAAKKWADDYKTAHANDDSEGLFASLIPNNAEYLAGEAPENAEAFIQQYLKEECLAVYWSLYPVLPDSKQFPDNPEWPLMNHYLGKMDRKEYA